VAGSNRTSSHPSNAHVHSSKRKKRVLLISHYHPELIRGGAQQCCYELFQGLKQEADIEPFFVSWTHGKYTVVLNQGGCITGFFGREN
jgi:hypothetical protein